MLRKLKHLLIAVVAIPCLYATSASAGMLELSSGDINLAIADEGYDGTTGSMESDTVSALIPGVITDVDVSVTLTHTWIGDLVLMLAGPDSTLITLMSRPGMDENEVSCCGASNEVELTTITFSDEASVASEDWTGVAGSYTPNDLLGIFDGTSMLGDWTLYVGDGEELDVGSLVNWTLNIKYQEVPLPSSILLMGLGLLALRVAKRR